MSEPKNQNMDAGTITLNVGGKPRDLMFSAAARFRLFLNIPVTEVQNYIVTDLFKINAVAMILYGKASRDKSIDDVLDMFEDDGLSDLELEAIVGWVRKRTLNFMLSEVEDIAQTLREVMPQAIELSNTLNGIQR